MVQCVVLKFCICSWGDRSYEFRSCVSDCDAVNCTGSGVEERLPWVLRLLRWSCGEECQYQCMWQVTSEDVRLNRPVKQFFGKVGNSIALTYNRLLSFGFCAVAFCESVWCAGASIGNLFCFQWDQCCNWIQEIPSTSSQGLSISLCLTIPVLGKSKRCKQANRQLAHLTGECACMDLVNHLSLEGFVLDRKTGLFQCCFTHCDRNCSAVCEVILGISFIIISTTIHHLSCAEYQVPLP